MAAALKLFTQQQLEAALSVEVVRNCCDEDRDGEADAHVVAQLQEDAATYVLTGLERVYPTLLGLAAGWQSNIAATPLKLRLLATDVAMAMLAKKHPTYVKRDYKGLFAHVDASIARIRKDGLDGLGIVGDPEPASNIGGTVWAGGDDTLIENEPMFNGPGGLGDFSR
jgi:hypothetical protein